MKFLVIVAAAFTALFGLGWGVVFRFSTLIEMEEERERRARRHD